jgi:hypothetical protein
MERHTISRTIGVLSALGLSAAAQAAEHPTVFVQPNAPLMVTINYTHVGDDGVESFRIERDGAEIKTAYVPEGQLIDPYLEADTQYVYRVCAIYPEEEACSPDIPVRTQPPERPPINMDPPININVEATETAIQVSWGAIGEYTRILARIEGDDGYIKQVDLEPKANRAYAFRDLRTGVRHRVSLKGCTKTLLGSSCGPWSAAHYATTVAATAEPPRPTKPTLESSLIDGTPLAVSLKFTVQVMQGEGDRFVVYRGRGRLKEVAPVGAASSVHGFDGWSGSFVDIPENWVERDADYRVCFEGHFPPARVCSDTVRVTLPAPLVVEKPDINPDLIVKDNGVEEKRDTSNIFVSPN